jgi:hypothetical protein
MNCLPRLALNCDPFALCLLSTEDYRREPLAPAIRLLKGLLSCDLFFTIFDFYH